MPAVLREALLTPLPAPAATALGGRYQFLGDLDESVWRYGTPEVCLHQRLRRLPLIVKWQVIRVPSSLLRLEDLNAGLRAVNCLRRLCKDDLREFATLTVEDLVRGPGMGAKSLLDALCALEAQAKLTATPFQMHLKGVIEEPLAVC